MNKYTIYMHRNKINNKIYIGLTKQKPQQRWKHDGTGYKTQPKFWRAIQKYGWDNFDHIILATELSQEQASQIEINLIQIFDSINNGYNISLGGTTTNHSSETLKKMSQSMTGKQCSEETKKKISESNYHTNIKQKIYCVETHTYYNSIAEASQQTGIDRSSITKVCKGKMNSAGGYHWNYASSPINIQKDKRYRPVLCITTNKAYKNMSEAGRDTNSDNSNIKKVCDGKYKTTNGLKWKYITNEEYERYSIND